MNNNGPESQQAYQRFVLQNSADIDKKMIIAATHVANRPLSQQETIYVLQDRSVIDGTEEIVRIRPLDFYAYSPANINGYRVTYYENPKRSRKSKLIVGPYSGRLYLSG